MDAYATINNKWETSQNTGYLLSNIYKGIGELWEWDTMWTTWR